MRHLLHGHLFLLIAFIAPTAGCAVSERISQPSAPVHDENADRVAIDRLVVEYSYLLDHGRANELAMLFTSNGVFENPNLGLRAVGRGAIAAYYAKRAAEPRTTRHITTNLRLVFETPDRASGTRTILYYRGDGIGPTFPAKPGAVGEYTEVFQREGGKWRFASRVNSLIFFPGTDAGRCAMKIGISPEQVRSLGAIL
jgi:hypothetical protein